MEIHHQFYEVDAIVVSIWILERIGWTGPLRWFEYVSDCVILPPWFSWGSGLLEYWIDCMFKAGGSAVLSGSGSR